MSILANKNILVVGDETSQIHNVEAVLETEGMHVHPTTCDMVSFETIEHDKIDIVLLNHLHEGVACTSMLTELRNRRMYQVLPIIALVENTPAKIDEALSLGAADYITSDEPIKSVVQKMKTILGEPEIFANTTLIDISPEPVVKDAGTGRVFIIEDDQLLRNLITLRLDKTGYDYATNSGDQSVMSELESYNPDVLILDLMLPGKDGFELLKEIREHSDTKISALPVIVFSNRDSQTDRQQVMNLGINAYFVKAMTDLAELVEAIKNTLAKGN